MHNAASKNSLNVARLLIDGGANIEAQDNRCDTPLGSTARKNSRDVARLLIDSGADIDAKSHKGGKTALHIAAWNNSLEITRLLIERGANTDGIDLSWMDDHEDA